MQKGKMSYAKIVAFLAVALSLSFAGSKALACGSGDGDDQPLCFCGDGKLDRGEQCDDGNRDDRDGCSSRCQNEVIITKEVPVEHTVVIKKTKTKVKIKKVKVYIEKKLPATGNGILGISSIAIASGLVVVGSRKAYKKNKA